MSRFIGELSITPLTSGRGKTLWRVNEPFGFHHSPCAITITVPSGFIGDLASVPRITKAIIDDDDPDIVEGAVIHDYIYRHRGNVFGSPAETLTRLQADEILREAMKVRRASLMRVMLVFTAVRIGGASAWNQSL